MSDSAIRVVVDERMRLLMAALAASRWPEMEQAFQTHAVHQHSKQTRQFVGRYRGHPAVEALDEALACDVPLRHLFSTVAGCDWPKMTMREQPPAELNNGRLPEYLAEFYEETALASHWDEHTVQWETARTELASILEKSRLRALLERIAKRPFDLEVEVMPCIVYPMLEAVVAQSTSKLLLILPPSKAWGESPPWPFGEDPGWVIATVAWNLAPHLMANTLSGRASADQMLIRHAAVTLCLEEELDEAEAMAYMVRSRKEHQLPNLSLVVESLRDFLADPAGRSLDDLEY